VLPCPFRGGGLLFPVLTLPEPGAVLDPPHPAAAIKSMSVIRVADRMVPPLSDRE